MTPYYADDWLTVFHGDAAEVLRTLEPESVNCVVTSPPYWGLRDYGTPGQLGLESTPEAYVAVLVETFREVRRVLRSDGTVWLNLGDSYAAQGGSSWPAPTNTGNVGAGHSERRNNKPLPGLKPKDLVGIPWRVAFALQADGWYLRSDIIWSKPNPMPESVTDRPTKSHEYLFLLSKSPRYYFDADAVREAVSETPGAGAWRRMFDPAKQTKEAALKVAGKQGGPIGHRDPDAAGRNIRSVWTIATQPYPGAHFATFPPKLVEPCVKAGCPEGGTVLDPFAGSGTVGLVAQSLSRRAVLIDLSMDYLGQLMDRNRDIPLGLVV